MLGNWTISDGEIIQRSNQQPAMIVCPENIEAEKYTFKTQAKKISGAEGFIAMFGYKDVNNYMWYNVGGWSNTLNNIEQSIDGNRVAMCNGERFKVDPGRWYDLQVEVDGDSVRCYLDGKFELACKAQKGSAYEGVYATTTIDDAAKMMYVKVVNVGDGYADGIINLSNCEVDTDKEDAVSLIRLASEKGNDENTIANPRNIYPVTTLIKESTATGIPFKVPAYSINILKIRLK